MARSEQGTSRGPNGRHPMVRLPSGTTAGWCARAPESAGRPADVGRGSPMAADREPRSPTTRTCQNRVMSMSTATPPDPVDAYLVATAERRLARFVDFLRIPSISGIPEHAAGLPSRGRAARARPRRRGPRARRGRGDRRSSDRLRGLAAGPRRAHRPPVRTLRRPAGRPARRVGGRPVRAARARRAGPRARRGGRQVEHHDRALGRGGAPGHPRGAPRQPASSSSRARRSRARFTWTRGSARTRGRLAADVALVADAGFFDGNLPAITVGLRGLMRGGDPRPGPVPGRPLGRLRRRDREPDQRARRDHRRAQGPRRADPHPGLLRRRRGARRRRTARRWPRSRSTRRPTAPSSTCRRWPASRAGRRWSGAAPGRRST